MLKERFSSIRGYWERAGRRVFPLSAGGVQAMEAPARPAVRLVIDKLNRNDRGVPALRQTILMPGHGHEGRMPAPLTRGV